MKKIRKGFITGAELNCFMDRRMQVYRHALGPDFTCLHEQAATALRILVMQYHAGFLVWLAAAVFCQKLDILAGMVTKSEMQEVLEPSKAVYEMGRWFPTTQYHLESEELMRLCVIGLEAPLKGEYVNRIESLTKKYFADK